jgi:hypothetical protein
VLGALLPTRVPHCAKTLQITPRTLLLYIWPRACVSPIAEVLRRDT